MTEDWEESNLSFSVQRPPGLSCFWLEFVVLPTRCVQVRSRTAVHESECGGFLHDHDHERHPSDDCLRAVEESGDGEDAMPRPSRPLLVESNSVYKIERLATFC